MQILYCERFIEFCIDLLAQLPTRRFFRPVVIDQHLIVRAQLSALYKLSAGGQLISGGGVTGRGGGDGNTSGRGSGANTNTDLKSMIEPALL